MTIYNLLQEPLTHAFMQRAMLAAIMVGAISGALGCFVVIRGMSFLGDGLSHAILPGVVVAYITGGTLFIGGLAAGIGTALVIGWLTRDNRLKEDTAIGIVFVSMFALGIALISANPQAYSRDLVHILFGDILGIKSSDLQIMFLCGVVVCGTIILLYKELAVISFDLGLARTLKLPTEGLRLLLLVLIAVTIVASLQIVGVTLMLSMLITPAATARIMTIRLHHMIFTSVIIGVLCGMAGIYISYHLDIATGPSIVLTMTAVFTLVFSASRIRGRLLRRV